MITQQGPVFVIGALNLDMCGTPHETPRPRDSTPGRVTIGAGGVGHNIAMHLAALGVSVELATIIGNDAAAGLLIRLCEDEGIGLTYALRHDAPSSTYICIHDTLGDMTAAVNDMALLEAFTKDRLDALLPAINSVPLVIADANLPRDTLEALAYAAKPPLLLDPVSGFKAERVRDFIGQFTAIKPNRPEAEQLTGEADPERAAKWFLAQGVRKVFISLSAEGIYFADAVGCGYLPAPYLSVSSYTGAGDAMAAGIALGMLRDENAEACAKRGMEAAQRHLQK